MFLLAHAQHSYRRHFVTVQIVGITTLVGAIAIALIAWGAARRRTAASVDTVRPGVYRARRNYFFVLVAVIIVALVMTLQRLPYPASTKATPVVTVEVEGMTWLWQFKEDGKVSIGGSGIVVPVGQPVRFDVGALDVNHGFGVYHPDGHIIGQVQAMPGYRNSVTLTFPEAGTYKILCLEYCGVGHHNMFASIEAR